MSRSLPKRNNPLILAEQAPSFEELLARRRLGKTNLAVKASWIGTSNATKPENLGLFEYAHLRAPLPKDLKGSEIFPSHTPQQHPETYFLMRRSKDGYVSATGMFKIAFPWAKLDEERSERDYLKTRDNTSEDEIAGNVWISPSLELAKEYKMYDWVRALLDPTDIVQSPSSAKKHITPPPKFELPESDAAPSSISASPSRRSRRSVSPSKKSPSKVRGSRAKKDVPPTPSTTAANASLQSALNMDAESVNETIESVEEDIEVKTSGSPKKTKGRKSKKDSTVEPEDKKAEKADKKKKKADKHDGEKEKTKTEKTTVSADAPITLPEVPSAEETKEMIAKAKGMVQEAIKAEGAAVKSASAKVTKKRKGEDLSEDEDEETGAERAKKAKLLEDKLKRERVRNRALVGVSAAFALAASIPYFF
ncbi:hypothetical protein N7510_003985 [Penicillium lagena]|uniref:uncharacterized protein n=1 Tax=Penicillium lagena TaxID=94218 RepID=UPI002542528D|nr:uncharacterized protein N7510_003985 [Penicillium lagena]KAJ5620001.1 hypothetical protein N7510_003985 [Penicillium lagena]